jgi:hypothetical protein
MPNTVTQRTVFGGGDDRLVVRLINIVSDGSEETDLVVYDNSTLVADVTRGSLIKVLASGSSCVCRLEWGQSTDSPIASFDPSQVQEVCFKEFGGVTNPKGTGATGDILLTTSALDSGDEVTLVLFIRQ